MTPAIYQQCRRVTTPCHVSRVTCHAGADADSARDIMNLSSGSCLNAPLAPALLFQCWYLQLRDGGNLKLQLFWSVHSGWPGLAAAVCRLGLDIYGPRPVRGTLTMRPPSRLWPAQHGGLQSWHQCTLICILFISRLVCRKHLLALSQLKNLFRYYYKQPFKYGLSTLNTLFNFKCPFIIGTFCLE